MMCRLPHLAAPPTRHCTLCQHGYQWWRRQIDRTNFCSTTHEQKIPPTLGGRRLALRVPQREENSYAPQAHWSRWCHMQGSLLHKSAQLKQQCWNNGPSSSQTGSAAVDYLTGIQHYCHPLLATKQAQRQTKWPRRQAQWQTARKWAPSEAWLVQSLTSRPDWRPSTWYWYRQHGQLLWLNLTPFIIPSSPLACRVCSIYS